MDFMTGQQYRNLLEGVDAPALMARRKALLESCLRGELQIDLGTLRESVGSDFFVGLTADVAHKRAMKGFDAVPGANDWRKIVVVNAASDFKLQNAVRTGSYARLDTVPESGGYKAKLFTDENASYKVAKYGNTENWSLEASANDELGRLGRTQERLGGAAMRTLLNFIFNTNIDANPTTSYDSKSLFHADHNNDLGATTPLSVANLEAAWKKLRAQTGLDSEEIDLVPRMLIVHTDEEVLAHRLVGSAMLRDFTAGAAGSAEMNFFNGRLEVIATPFVTSGKWYLVADPAQTDTIEIGFFRNQQNPSTFVEAKNSGHEFSNDAMRTKTRFIFGGTVLDHRWIVRGAA